MEESTKEIMYDNGSVVRLVTMALCEANKRAGIPCEGIGDDGEPLRDFSPEERAGELLDQGYIEEGDSGGWSHPYSDAVVATIYMETRGVGLCEKPLNYYVDRGQRCTEVIERANELLKSSGIWIELVNAGVAAAYRTTGEGE